MLAPDSKALPAFRPYLSAHAQLASGADSPRNILEQCLAALDHWEPRIEVVDVDFDLSGVDRGELLINIGYRMRPTNHLRNLVYPFYVIPAEDQEP